MPGRHVTARQRELYMTARANGATQALAAAKAGVSVRTGRTLEHHPERPVAGRRAPRDYRTRPDPFEEVWEPVVLPMLTACPQLLATTILEELQARYPGRFDTSTLRTLQRRIRSWRALHGPEREVCFPQSVQPGWQMLCDFTVMDRLGITVAGEPLLHRLAHVRLRYSGWAHAEVVLGGESYTALASAVVHALEAFGGVPETLRTDSLSAAFANRDVDVQDDARIAFLALCAHYGLEATRNNRGQSHENGGIESPHGHLKRAIDQALLVRGTRNFDNLDAYREFIASMISKGNARRTAAMQVERQHLRPLPERAHATYSVRSHRVSSTSTIDVARCTYSVPSRLRGHQLTVHLFDDRIECFLGIKEVFSAQRLRASGKNARTYQIDYRHVISSLVRKPGAFRSLSYRDALHPSALFRTAWERLDATQPYRQAPRLYLEFLRLAAVHDQDRIAAYLEDALAGRQPLDPHACERHLNQHVPAPAALASVQVAHVSPQAYDALLCGAAPTVQR